MLYERRLLLEQRGAVEPGEPSEVAGTLLIGIEPALEYNSDHSSYGHDSVSLFPAFHNGVKCWVQQETWCPAYGYSASGTQEFIIPFEDGVRIFLEQDVFLFRLAQQPAGGKL